MLYFKYDEAGRYSVNMMKREDNSVNIRKREDNSVNMRRREDNSINMRKREDNSVNMRKREDNSVTMRKVGRLCRLAAQAWNINVKSCCQGRLRPGPLPASPHTKQNSF
jgi:chorismate synthase